jgi:tetratricopeptide (TPR) repeat protein
VSSAREHAGLGFLGRSLLLAGLAVAIGCDRSPSNVKSSGTPPPDVAATRQLEPLPRPSLQAIDPDVASRLEAAQKRVADRSESGAVDAELGSAWGELGRLYHAYELFDAALPCYRNASLLAPEDPRWPYYQGQLLRARGDLDGSAAAFERALELAPDDVATLRALAAVARDRRRADQAEAYARRTLAIDGDDASALLVVAELAAERGNHAAAAQAYETLLRLQPSATRLHHAAATAYRQQGDLAKADQHSRAAGDGKLVIADPRMAELEALRAGVAADAEAAIEALRGGDARTAAGLLGRAVVERPDDATLRVNLGSALRHQGDLEGARREYLEAVRLDPTLAIAHFNLGVVEAERGDQDAATRAYQQAMSADPTYRDPRLNLANTLLRLGRQREALELYRGLVENDPGDEAARLGEALSLMRDDRHREALRTLEAGLEIQPGSVPLIDGLARLLASAPDVSVRDGNRALALAQDLIGRKRSVRNLETLGMALAEVGRFADAIAAQEEAIRLAGAAGRPDVASELAVNLELYRSRSKLD